MSGVEVSGSEIAGLEAASLQDHPSETPTPRQQTTLGHRLRGVSVHFLATTFIDEVLAAGLERDAKVYDIEPVVIRPKGHGKQCPRDMQDGAAYIDCLDENDAGIATHMLSYTWGYMVGDIADSLMLFL